jgi:hypothetical protein
MIEPFNSASVSVPFAGLTAVVYAGAFVDKRDGHRLAAECERQFALGCDSLRICFRATQQVNSVGVSLLLTIILAAQQTDRHLVFAHLDQERLDLFRALGLGRHVCLQAADANQRTTFLQLELPVNAFMGTYDR